MNIADGVKSVYSNNGAKEINIFMIHRYFAVIAKTFKTFMKMDKTLYKEKKTWANNH